MKKHNVIEFILVGLLVCAGLSCKSASSANTAANGNTSLTDSANSNTIVAKKPLPTPATNCPSENLRPGESLKDEIKHYEGCRVTITGILFTVSKDHVKFVNFLGREKDSIYCTGDFSSDIYSQIGAKLESLKQKEQFRNLPFITLKSTVRTTQSPVSDELYTELKECVITDLQKQ